MQPAGWFTSPDQAHTSLLSASTIHERHARGDDAAFDAWLNASPALPPEAGDELTTP